MSAKANAGTAAAAAGTVWEATGPAPHDPRGGVVVLPQVWERGRCRGLRRGGVHTVSLGGKGVVDLDGEGVDVIPKEL